MDRYELVTYLEIHGEPKKVLRRVYLDVEYETDDRNSFVYTRTRKIGQPVQKYELPVG